jgi:16S rRNA (guanine527-N7)-methyltransferase
VSFAALEKAIQEAGLQSLTPTALEKFENYLGLVLKWNAKLNLTAVREPGQIVRRHFVECIQCAQALPEPPHGSTVLDFGSGAGLPGIPIAICRPELRVTLAESQGKKAAFLREACRCLDLKADVFDRRVEEMDPKQVFSFVTLRAVEKMVEACRTALDRVGPRGWMVLFATEATEMELTAVLPEICWRKKLPIPELETGCILLGDRCR